MTSTDPAQRWKFGTRYRIPELRAALEVSPWTVGTPLTPANPTVLGVATIGPAGTGQVVYHVIERERLVPIIQVTFV